MSATSAALPRRDLSTATERLARFTVGVSVGADVRRAAIPIVLDTLAVTLAGGAEPGVRALMAACVSASGKFRSMSGGSELCRATRWSVMSATALS